MDVGGFAMKHATETMNRRSEATMNRRPEEQMVSRCEVAKLALMKKPLPASVQGAPGETHPVAARKPA